MPYQSNNYQVVEQPSIAQIPPEILSIIFQLHQSACRGSMDEFQRWDNEPRWISVAQVCQAWRETALGCPELWSSIEMPGPRNLSTDFENMQLELSQDRLLTVQSFLTYRAQKGVNEKVSQTVISLIPRIKALKLVCNDYIILKSLLDRFTTLPELVSLSVGNEDNFPVYIPGDAPKLQLLHLAGRLRMPFPSGGHSLTHFRLGSHRARRSQIPWPELRDMLRPFQKTLKTLALDAFLEGVPNADVFDHHPPLHFTQLEELALCQPPGTIHQLLGWIRVPASTKLDLRNAYGQGPNHYGFQKILSAVSTFCLPATRPQLNQLSLFLECQSMLPTADVQIKGWIHENPMGSNCSWEFLTEAPSLALEQRYVLYAEIDRVLSLSTDRGIWGIPGYSISELENLELTLDGGWRQGPQFLWDTLARLSKLKNIRIRKSIPNGFIISLEEDSESIRRLLKVNSKVVPPGNTESPQPQASQTARRFAPLRSITLENVKFWSKPEQEDLSTTTLGQLLHNLRLRHELGCALERLVFRGCQGVRAAELEDFAQYVSELEKYVQNSRFQYFSS